jgi:hypothetical protein
MAAKAVRSWDLPPGIEKVAAQRDGDQGELPEPTRDNIWRHPNAHPATLMLLLLDKYGQDIFEWDPEVLLVTLKRDGISTSNSVRLKILAGRVVLNSPSPWRRWEAFHWTALGLAGEPPNFIYMEEPEIGHLVAAMDFMKLADPSREVGEEVDKYVAAVFKTEAIPYIPEPLHFAQRELEEPKIRCRSCGAIHRDDNDQRCVTCGSPQLQKIPYEYADYRDDTKKLWNNVKNLPLPSAVDRAPADTPEGNAVYRLLVHWDYANQVRTHLNQQLRILGG